MAVRAVSLLLLAVGVRAAAAAPAADLVLAWTPGRDTAPVAAVARTAGAAFVDRTPARPDPLQGARVLASALQRGIDAYDALRFDDAWVALEEARVIADRTGAVGLAPTRLADLWLYRSLVRGQRADPDGAWDDLVAALVVAPARVLDPARFSPRVGDELERARAAVVARPRAVLDVVAPGDCTVTIDGDPVAPGASRITGAHWVRAECREREAWGARVVLVEPGTRVVAAVRAVVPPSEADSLVQARAASARAVLVIEATGAVATLRVLGVDGRERDRRTVTLASGDSLEPVARAARELLAPAAARPHWYRSRWAWAAGAAVVAAAIAIPLTAAIAGDDRPSPSVVGPQGLP